VVKRDLSLIFPEMVTAWEIEKTVRDHGGVVLKKIEFFDLYRGKQLPAGKKSVSISLKFQSAERTLTDEEVEGYIRSIITGLEQLGGELRRI
jgi:phenylalanyl-tRNA synthetase beta chain